MSIVATKAEDYFELRHPQSRGLVHKIGYSSEQRYLSGIRASLEWCAGRGVKSFVMLSPEEERILTCYVEAYVASHPAGGATMRNTLDALAHGHGRSSLGVSWTKHPQSAAWISAIAEPKPRIVYPAEFVASATERARKAGHVDIHASGFKGKASNETHCVAVVSVPDRPGTFTSRLIACGTQVRNTSSRVVTTSPR